MNVPEYYEIFSMDGDIDVDLKLRGYEWQAAN